MATITTQQERKDIIVPGERYHVTHELVIDEATLIQVGVRVTETHSEE
jgi:hypothetical protein